ELLIRAGAAQAPPHRLGRQIDLGLILILALCRAPVAVVQIAVVALLSGVHSGVSAERDLNPGRERRLAEELDTSGLTHAPATVIGAGCRRRGHVDGERPLRTTRHGLAGPEQALSYTPEICRRVGRKQP